MVLFGREEKNKIHENNQEWGKTDNKKVKIKYIWLNKNKGDEKRYKKKSKIGKIKYNKSYYF